MRSLLDQRWLPILAIPNDRWVPEVELDPSQFDGPEPDFLRSRHTKTKRLISGVSERQIAPFTRDHDRNINSEQPFPVGQDRFR